VFYRWIELGSLPCAAAAVLLRLCWCGCAAAAVLMRLCCCGGADAAAAGAAAAGAAVLLRLLLLRLLLRLCCCGCAPHVPWSILRASRPPWWRPRKPWGHSGRERAPSRSLDAAARHAAAVPLARGLAERAHLWRPRSAARLRRLGLWLVRRRRARIGLVVRRCGRRHAPAHPHGRRTPPPFESIAVPLQICAAAQALPLQICAAAAPPCHCRSAPLLRPNGSTRGWQGYLGAGCGASCNGAPGLAVSERARVEAERRQLEAQASASLALHKKVSARLEAERAEWQVANKDRTPPLPPLATPPSSRSGRLSAKRCAPSWRPGARRCSQSKRRRRSDSSNCASCAPSATTRVPRSPTRIEHHQPWLTTHVAHQP
jgi:hypothetical protein